MRGPARNQITGSAGRHRVRVYSRLVAWMKVLLPLSAMALIAVIFLTARNTGDLTKIFTAEELVTLGAGLRLDNPRFAGLTDQGEPFAIRADWALPDSTLPQLIDLQHPEGEIEMKDGRTIAARADSGRMHRENNTMVLKGGVVLDTSDGYHVATDLIEIDIDAKTAHAPGPVSGTGPDGRIDAGSMRAAAGEDGAGAGTIWFENRVRVVFIPAKGRANGKE
jgi:lipopolysaccharide export system protein LptC